MIVALRKLLLGWREPTPPPTPLRPDIELRVLAAEALDRWVAAWRANPMSVGGAEAVSIIKGIYAREDLTEAEFLIMADHYDAATTQFMDEFWAERLRAAVPAGRA